MRTSGNRGLTLKQADSLDDADGRAVAAGAFLRPNLPYLPRLPYHLLPYLLLVLQHPKTDGKDPSGN